MAKIYGLQGVMTGKLANTVMAVRNGEQIARKYQPVVFNPSTEAQVAARAKLKLMSQLSAVMAPVIAIPRRGPVSSRNIFTKINYAAATYENSEADIELSAVKLTDSVVSLPALLVDATGANVVVKLAAASPSLSRVIYVIFVKQSDNTLRLLNSSVNSDPGAANDFPTEFSSTTGQKYVIYAYGVRDNTAAARAKFGDLTVPTAESVAKIITTRQLTEADITLTETRYTLLSA